MSYISLLYYRRKIQQLEVESSYCYHDFVPTKGSPDDFSGNICLDDLKKTIKHLNGLTQGYVIDFDCISVLSQYKE